MSGKGNMNESTIQLLGLPPKLESLIPPDAVCKSTIELAHKNLELAIFNHSLRVFFHAVNLLSKERSQGDFVPPTFFPHRVINRRLLFIAALCHDLGTASIYNGRQRFEVEGADAACSHMRSAGLNTESDLQNVWSAIALHTSTGIAERFDPLTRAIRLAVKIDFSQDFQARFRSEDFALEIEKYLPRMDIEKVLADAVVAQADKILEDATILDNTMWPDSEKHPKASWPGILLRAHMINPAFKGINPAF